MFPTFAPASPQARAIEHLFIGVLGILFGILLLVIFLVTYNAIRYRASRPGAIAEQITGQTRLEVLWTSLPAALLLGLFIFTVIAMRQATSADASGAGDPRTPEIELIGHQFWWEVRYPATGVVTANEIHIPANQPVLMRLDSADVIHDFWVPALGRKLDAIPGHRNDLWLSAAPGLYRGTCSQYCGAEHAFMRLRVIAQPPAEFAAWIAAQQRPAAAPQTPLAQQGAQEFGQLGCPSCHAIRAAGAARPAGGWPRFGPDLTHVASRQTLGAGVLSNTPRNLRAWLRNPQVIKPACLMPNFQLQPAQVQALSAYLEGLS